MLASNTPDLTALDLLCSVEELPSLGQVAARHHLSQPAVSMRMSALERRLGLGLMQRDSSGTRLTAAGERVVAVAHRVLAEVESLMSTVGGLRAEGSLLLRVAASLTVADHLLPVWIGTVHQEIPGVSLTLEVTNSSQVVAAVTEGRVDIGFVEGHPRDLPGLQRSMMAGDQLVVVVGPAHPWVQRRDPLRGEELAATELIVREKGSGTREIIEDALAPWGGVRTRLELGSPSAIVTAARRTGGPAVLSELAVAEELAEGRLVKVETAGMNFRRSFQAIWLSDRPLPTLALRLLAAAGEP